MSDEVALDQGGTKRVHRGIWTRSVMSPSVTRAELMASHCQDLRYDSFHVQNGAKMVPFAG